MKSFKVGRYCRWGVVVGLLALVTVVASPRAVHSQKEGLRIKIKAQNQSAADTPFCGVGGGLVGDKLVVNVFTNLSGVTTGEATFTPHNGPAITLHVDRIFTFCCGGLALADSSTNNVIAIWLDNSSAPTHVNVELPRGCENTKSTFTAGVDKLSLQIKLTGDDDDD